MFKNKQKWSKTSLSKTINILVSVPSIFSTWERGEANLIDFKNLTYVKKVSSKSYPLRIQNMPSMR